MVGRTKNYFLVERNLTSPRSLTVLIMFKDAKIKKKIKNCGYTHCTVLTVVVFDIMILVLLSIP